MKFTYSFLILILINVSLFSQYVEYSLEERSSNSSLIVEAIVRDKSVFELDGTVFSAYKLEICNYLYASNNSLKSSNEIYVLTYGGETESRIQSFTHTLNLSTNDEGLFFLSETNIGSQNLPEIGANCFHSFGGNQGFVSINYDENYQLGTFDGLKNYSHIQSVIDSVYYYINYPAQSSCLLENKSGLVINSSSLATKSDTIFAVLNVKGMYSKHYDIQETSLYIELSDTVDLNAINFYVEPQATSLKNNYITNWSQPSSNYLKIDINKIPNGGNSFEINNFEKEFIEIGITQSIASLSLNQITIPKAIFLDSNSESIEFNEYHFNIDDGILQMKPDLHRFEPLVVASGLTQNEADGSDYLGAIEIHGENFGSIPNEDFSQHIPWNYSVRFVRDNFSYENQTDIVVKENLKITPHFSDYEVWNDTLIKVKVPTYGYYVNGDDIIPFNTPMQQGAAITGDIHVQRALLFDESTKPGEERELKVAFSILNMKTASDAIPNIYGIPNYHDDAEGVYQFVIDTSFHNNINGGGSSQEFENRLKDAFCYWNSKSDLKVQIVDSCTTSLLDELPCGRITAFPIDSSSFNTVAFTVTGYLKCEDQRFISDMSINFGYGQKSNGDSIKWFTGPVFDSDPPEDSLGIFEVALHEIGHVLQLGHVREDTSLMYFAGFNDINSASRDGSFHVRSKSVNNSVCSASTGSLAGCVTSTVDYNHMNDFFVFPTIFSNTIDVKSDSKIKNIKIYTVNGLEILAKSNINSYEIQLLFDTEINGIFFIKIEFVDGSYGVKKIIKL